MAQTNSTISDIIYRQLKNEELSAEEQALMDAWLLQSPENGLLLNKLTAEGEWQEYLSIRSDTAKNKEAWERFEASINNAGKTETVVSPVHRVHFLRKWGWAAASIVLLLGIAGYFWLKPGKAGQEPVIAQTDSIEIQPGKSGAILTLADGSMVSLDSVQNGVIALQGGARAKVVNGTLLYEGQGQAMLFNTMSTPKGRQFQVTLPDGTDVWLNAASSIRYPTAFSGNDRKVEITGEVYFEVKKDIKPFIVSADNRSEITVLGTHFNINSYINEGGVKTTLLSGAVQVNKGVQSVVIKPGEQAEVQESINVKKEVDLDKVMAWKAGLFNFEDVSLAEAMRQLERWYDIEVIYENGIPKKELKGEMSRDITLNGLMNVLKVLGVNYRLEERKLFILQK